MTLWFSRQVPDFVWDKSIYLTYDQKVQYKGWYYYDDSLFTTQITEGDLPDFTFLDVIEVWVDQNVEGDDHPLRVFDYGRLYAEDGLRLDGVSPETESYDIARRELGGLFIEYLCCTNYAVKIFGWGSNSHEDSFLLSPGVVRQLSEIAESLDYPSIGLGVYGMVEEIEYMRVFNNEVDSRVVDDLGVDYWDTPLRDGCYSIFMEFVRRNGWAANKSYFDLADDLKVAVETARRWFPTLYDVAGEDDWYAEMVAMFEDNFIVVDGELVQLGVVNEQ